MKSKAKSSHTSFVGMLKRAKIRPEDVGRDQVRFSIPQPDSLSSSTLNAACDMVAGLDAVTEARVTLTKSILVRMDWSKVPKSEHRKFCREIGEKIKENLIESIAPSEKSTGLARSGGKGKQRFRHTPQQQQIVPAA